MKYISTRGRAPVLDFEEVVLAGLASDGGLYVPETVPHFTPAQIASFASLSYSELAFQIIRPFTGGTIEDEALASIINESYATFRHEAVAPLKQLSLNEWLLELFHGPTLAFKDFALQFLGRTLDHILQKRGEKIVIVGATSGDTGSAAIAGCRGRKGMDIFILHPKGRVSDVQRRQMTTVLDANVHNIALEGSFDDCQDVVKALFADEAFRTEHKLGAVNSINWARILAQVVYYFYAAVRLGAPAKTIDFCVPTGNFGDIYAGYIAKRMGLPIGRLIIASNRNDILTRCLNSGTYGMEGVTPSLSPSMDIQISSNFERLLFDVHARDGAVISEMMNRFRAEKSITLGGAALAEIRKTFCAARADDALTAKTIKDVYEATGEVIDPHTAVGVAAGRQCQQEGATPLVVLATAHPAKFPDAVKAATKIYPALPAHLADLFSREEKLNELANNLETIKTFISTHKTA